MVRGGTQRPRSSGKCRTEGYLSPCRPDAKITSATRARFSARSAVRLSRPAKACSPRSTASTASSQNSQLDVAGSLSSSVSAVPGSYPPVSRPRWAGSRCPTVPCGSRRSVGTAHPCGGGGSGRSVLRFSAVPARSHSLNCMPCFIITASRSTTHTRSRRSRTPFPTRASSAASNVSNAASTVRAATGSGRPHPVPAPASTTCPTQWSPGPPDAELPCARHVRQDLRHHV